MNRDAREHEATFFMQWKSLYYKSHLNVLERGDQHLSEKIRGGAALD